MTDPTQFVKIGGLTFMLPATAKVVNLTLNGTISNTSAAALDASTGTAYQVPALRKLWILLAGIGSDNAGGVAKIYQGNASGGIDTLKITLGAPVGFSPIPIFIVIAASKYVTFNTSTGTQTFFAYAIELDV